MPRWGTGTEKVLEPSRHGFVLGFWGRFWGSVRKSTGGGIEMAKQIFISHTWLEDEEGRDTHQRAKALSDQLTHRGWTTWLDENEMRNNIDSSMATGIDESDIVLVLLTRKYARKINRGAKSAVASCLKEFAYALFRNKDVVPVVFERCMLNPESWSPGVVPMRFFDDILRRWHEGSIGNRRRNQQPAPPQRASTETANWNTAPRYAPQDSKKAVAVATHNHPSLSHARYGFFFRR